MRRISVALAILLACFAQVASAEAPTCFDSSATYIPLGDSLGDIVSSDFDHDGYVDFAMPLFGHDSVCVVFGDSIGAYSRSVRIAVGDGPRSMCVIDANGDSFDDLAVVHQFSQQLKILRNTGSTFYVDKTYDAGGPSPWTVIAAQIDTNSSPDILLVCYDIGLLELFRNQSTTQQVSFAPDSIGMYWRGQALAAGDFDGDGDQDVAVSLDYEHRYYRIQFFKNDNGYLHNELVTQKNFIGYDPRELWAGDFDGDGDIDLVAGNADVDAVSVLLNDGAETVWSDSGWTIHGYYGAGDDPAHICVADLTGDGNLDLATADWKDDKIAIFAGVGDGTLAVPIFYPAGDHPNGIVAADVDGDGNLDLATANHFGFDFSIHYNGGPCACDCPYQGDFDGNGYIDALDLNALIEVLFFGGPEPSDPYCGVSRGDLNDDGYPDGLDLNYLIDYLNFGGPAPLDPCD